MAADNRVIASYWDTASGTWTDFRVTTYNTSTNAYVYSATAASAVQSCNIVDKLYTPKKATLTISNRPVRPFSDNAATAGTQGPWTGKVGQFTRIKIVDGLSRQIYFVGFAFDIQDSLGALTIKAYDNLNELRDLTTANKPDFRINPPKGGIWQGTSLPIGSGIDRATNQYTDELASRSGIIKSIINLYANNLIAENTDAADNRFSNSASEFNFGPIASSLVTDTTIDSPSGNVNDSQDAFDVDAVSDNLVVDTIIFVDQEKMKILSIDGLELTVERGALNTIGAVHVDGAAVKILHNSQEIYHMNQGDSPTSLLTNIQHLAIEDPHATNHQINSGTGGQTYGYDYYVEPNFISTVLTTTPASSFFHYFKKGQRPTLSPTETGGLFNEGLNIHVPSPSSTANGEFSETGRLIACTDYSIERPQDEVYTEAAISWKEHVNHWDNAVESVTVEPKTSTFQLVQIGAVTNPNDVPGVFAPLGSEVNRNAGIGSRNGYYNGFVTDKGLTTDPKQANGASAGVIGTGRPPLIDGDGTDNGGKSPEWLKVRLSSLTADISNSTTTLAAVSTAGMYVGQKLQLGVTGTLGTAINTTATTIDFNPSYNGTFSWSQIAATEKILVHGISGTEEMTIAGSIDASAGTFEVSARTSSGTTNRGVAHESGALVELFPEIVTVTAVSSATAFNVTRNSTDTRSVTRNWYGNTNTEIYAWKVARPQMLSLSEVGNVNGGGIPASSETCDMLISDVDPNIIKGTSSTTYANKFDTYWKVNAYDSGWSGSSKSWIGQDSLSSFVLTYAPQNTYEYRRSINVDVSDIENSLTVRQRILAVLQRKTHQTLRTTLNTFRPPRYYFDDVIASIPGSGTSTQVLNLSGSTNPITEGLTIGCTVNQLSGGGPSGVYGYISDITSTTVEVTWSSGSGISATDTVRFYVPVRAGDLIKHRNDPSNINQMMRVTKVTYDENNGVALTRYDVVGATSSKEGGDARMTFAAPTYSGGGEISFPFSATDVPLEDKHNKLAIEFSVTDEDTVAWAAGDIYIGSKRYEIDAGNTGNMGVGISYTIYYYPGSNVFTVDTTSHYLRVKRSKYSKNIVKIATAYGVAASDGKAYFRLEPNLGTIKARDMSNAPDVLNTNSIKATLQKKGNQGWATDIIFEGTDWDDIKWHKVGSSDSTNANVSFSDDSTPEAITYGTKTFSGGELNKTIYAYKAVGDSASGTIVFTTDYTALYQDDRILLATFVTAASDDGTDSPSIFPFNGSQPTISAGLISAGAIVAEQIKAGTITTSQLNFTPETNTSDKTAGTVGGWKLNASNIYSGSAAVTSGYSAAADITLTSSGTIHAKEFYIDGSGNANFKGSISGASGTFTGSLTGATGTFGNCSMGSDGFVADGELLGFQIMNGSTHYGALGYNSGAVIISTTDNDASTVTPRMYFNDSADPIVQIPPGTSAEINEHRFAKFSAGGNEFATIYPEGDRDGTAGDPIGYIGVNASNAQAPYSRIYGSIFGAGAGSAATPSISFGSDGDTGIYNDATNNLAITTAGTQRFKIGSSGFFNYIWGIGSGTDVHVHADNYLLKNTSSIRYKDNVVNIETDTSKIYDLRPVTFDWNDKSAHPGKKDIGLIAEETEKIFPEIVNYGDDGLAESISYQKLSVLLLSEMTKLKNEIKKLKENQ